MSKALSKFLSIRSVLIKSILVFVGALLVVSTLYPFIMENLLLTDKQEEWDSTEWIMLGVGFFLAVGGAKYNSIIDSLTSKFQNGNPG